MSDYLYGVLVAVACFAALLLVWALVHHIVERAHAGALLQWEATKRDVGRETWVVIQLVRHGRFTRQVIGEQLIGAIPHNLSDYDYQVRRSMRKAELRAVFLNHGDPDLVDE